MTKLFGAAEIVVDGETLQTLPGAALDIGGTVRTARSGPRSVHGFSETHKEATIECEVTLPPGFSIKSLHDTADATITFRCDSGQSYVIRNAWCSAPPTGNDGDDARFSVNFAGPAAEEVLS